MAKRKKDYYPPMRVGMYVTNLYDADGNAIINLDAFDAELQRRIQAGYITSYAWIVHDKDKVDAEAVILRQKSREEMFVRRVYALRDDILSKEDLQNFVFTDMLRSDHADEAMACFNDFIDGHGVKVSWIVHPLKLSVNFIEIFVRVIDFRVSGCYNSIVIRLN